MRTNVPITKHCLRKASGAHQMRQGFSRKRGPALGLDELKTAEYEADGLWTARSIVTTAPRWWVDCVNEAGFVQRCLRQINVCNRDNVVV